MARLWGCRWASAVFCFFALLSCNCGDETVCDRFREVQKDICEGSDQCLTCYCLFKGKDLDVVISPIGLPDAEHSSCIKKKPCEENHEAWSAICLELNRPEPNDENYETWLDQNCDPRNWGQIRMFDQGQPAPGFEQVCGGHWD